jgi:cytochrome oxidase Cu insertion factor (SCO1/SenC/PrrC family)
MRRARLASRARAALAARLVAATFLGPSAAGGATVDDLLFDLQLAPLDAAAPPAFTLEALDGVRVSLADFKGRVVLLYFWAGW